LLQFIQWIFNTTLSKLHIRKQQLKRLNFFFEIVQSLLLSYPVAFPIGNHFSRLQNLFGKMTGLRGQNPIPNLAEKTLRERISDSKFFAVFVGKFDEEAPVERSIL